jgi:hypothetical protein
MQCFHRLESVTVTGFILKLLLLLSVIFLQAYILVFTRLILLQSHESI